MRRTSPKMRSESSTRPDWMRSPATPEHPEHVGEIPKDRREVVECDGRLYDRIVLYRWHDYAVPAVFEKAGAILAKYLRDKWIGYYGSGRGPGPDTDAQPKNREVRARLVALATEAAAADQSPVLDRRRAWRIIDWQIRTNAATLLALAGWADYAAAFRALPPITGPSALPRGAATLFRKAHRDTDKASTAAMRGVRPYRRDRTRRFARENPAHALDYAANRALPWYGRAVKDDDVPPAERTDLGRAVQAGAYASMCVDHDPRIPDAEVKHVLGELAASGEALLREIIAMGKGPEKTRRAA